ncbi:MAG: primosomal protein N' [Aerococcus sp.]|nr:primosomal protein N' [Aerococcus sp.]
MEATNRYASVIVDVPTQQTNRPFTYEVPEELRDTIALGMRVKVPFGVREVIGFVVGLSNTATYDGELRPLNGLMDEAPVVTQELLQLSLTMSERLVSFRIHCLEAMLPSMLRGQYEKTFYPTHTLTYMEREAVFQDDSAMTWKEAEARHVLATLLTWRKQDKVRLKYSVNDQTTQATETWIQPLLNYAQLEEEKAKLPKTATKQRLLCEVLMQLDGQRISVKALRDDYQLNLQTIRRGEEKGWLKRFDEIVDRDPYADKVIEQTTAKPLLPQQQAAYEPVAKAIDTNQAETYLLEGVTGSGKTELYMQWIQQALDRGQEAILLIPEIGLTPQIVGQLKGRFGDAVAVLHSRLSVGEQFDEWRKIKEGRAKIAVGPRSSIFAPFQNLGVIIIDEEHDLAYKQQQDPRYHTRDIAIARAQYHHCPVVLGSATPALESRARAQNKKYQLLRLTERANQRPLPTVSIVDMREEYKQKNYHQFSRKLYHDMKDTLAAGHQVALLLNRRGYANYLMCRDCGHVFTCVNCSVSLTYHRSEQQLRCHYCGYTMPLPQRCPVCGETRLRDFGSGTERVEEELNELFPNETVIRIDNDTTRRKNSYEHLLAKIRDNEAGILLGTQMIAKGLDFPNITLVGVLNADTSLFMPDFRSAERTFQLLTQVSGRAGRGETQGHVIFQTFNPDHYAIQLAAQQNYEAFYRTEKRYRKLNHYPPYYFTVQFTVSSVEANDAMRVAMQLGAKLRKHAEQNNDRVIGPSQEPARRLKKRYYFQILYQYRQSDTLKPVLEAIREQAQEWEKKRIYITIDIEPQQFL